MRIVRIKSINRLKLFYRHDNKNEKQNGMSPSLIGILIRSSEKK